jgi:hypothetical protein
MGAALLFCRHLGGRSEELEERFERVAAAFPGRIATLPWRTARTRDALVRVWEHASSRGSALLEDAGHRWLALVGNPTSRELAAAADTDAAAAFLLGEARSPRGLDNVSPPFAAVTYDGISSYRLEADRAGLQQAYVAEEPDAIWLSSSALALAAVLRTDVDADALAEWLSVGHFLSERTIVRGIRKLGAGETLELSSTGVSSHRRRPTPVEPDGDVVSAYAGGLVESVRATHVGEGISTELTGGLDTRMLLAVNLSQGFGGPTWTISQPGSDELVTIAQLRQRFTFPHETVTIAPSFAARLPELVTEMHELSDGEVNSIEYAPLLLAFEEAAASGRRVSVSGSGAELARGFYFDVLRARGEETIRGVPTGALTRKVTKYTGGVHLALRTDFAANPRRSAERVIEEFTYGSPGTSPEGILEDFYLRTRMQRFAGRNTSTTGVFYRQATPFFGNAFVELVLGLPPAAKRGGWVVRRAIEELCPALADVPLDTGMPVRPVTWRHPETKARKLVSYGRRGLTKFGGRLGRAIARRPPGTVAWEAAAAEPAFRDFVGDLLGTRNARLKTLFVAEKVDAEVDRAFSTGHLYPLGLLLTVELTLRRLESAPRATAATSSRSARGV